MLSIIIPKYNDFEGLKASLTSVEDQKYDCEIIVKDAKYCIQSYEFIQNANFQHAQTKYIVTEDEGIYDAINQAITFCTGNHIWVIGCGDIPHFKVISDIGLQPGITYSAPVLLFDGKASTEYTGRLTPSHQGMIYYSEAYAKNKYNPRYKIISDRIFYDEYVKKHFNNIRHIKEPICTFLLNGISSQKTSRKLILLEMSQYFIASPNFKNLLRLMSSLRNYLST